jgi:hypothetical protein
LDNDFVSGDGELFYSGLDLAHDVFNLSFGLSLIVFFITDVALDYILNNDTHFRWVESKSNVCGQVASYLSYSLGSSRKVFSELRVPNSIF